MCDNRLVYYLSGAVGTWMVSQLKSTDFAALTATPGFNQ